MVASTRRVALAVDHRAGDANRANVGSIVAARGLLGLDQRELARLAHSRQHVGSA